MAEPNFSSIPPPGESVRPAPGRVAKDWTTHEEAIQKGGATPPPPPRRGRGGSGVAQASSGCGGCLFLLLVAGAIFYFIQTTPSLPTQNTAGIGTRGQPQTTGARSTGRRPNPPALTVQLPVKGVVVLQDGTVHLGAIQTLTQEAVRLQDVAQPWSWTVVRGVRTAEADYQIDPTSGWVVAKPAIPGELRLFGPLDAEVELQGAPKLKGRVYFLTPEEIGFETAGKKSGQVYPARVLIRLRCAGTVYAPGASGGLSPEMGGGTPTPQGTVPVTRKVDGPIPATLVHAGGMSFEGSILELDPMRVLFKLADRPAPISYRWTSVKLLRTAEGEYTYNETKKVAEWTPKQ